LLECGNLCWQKENKYYFFIASIVIIKKLTHRNSITPQGSKGREYDDQLSKQNSLEFRRESVHFILSDSHVGFYVLFLWEARKPVPE
jgi:hypothetical protein